MRLLSPQKKVAWRKADSRQNNSPGFYKYFWTFPLARAGRIGCCFMLKNVAQCHGCDFMVTARRVQVLRAPLPGNGPLCHSSCSRRGTVRALASWGGLDVYSSSCSKDQLPASGCSPRTAFPPPPAWSWGAHLSVGALSSAFPPDRLGFH